MKKVFIIIILSFIMIGCENKESINTYITLEKIEEIAENKKYVIIDVRTKEEYNEGHIKESINIPYDEIDENIEIDKDKIIFVYCRSGNRSRIAQETLTQLGYETHDLGAYSNIDLTKE